MKVRKFTLHQTLEYCSNAILLTFNMHSPAVLLLQTKNANTHRKGSSIFISKTYHISQISTEQFVQATLSLMQRIMKYMQSQCLYLKQNIPQKIELLMQQAGFKTRKKTQCKENIFESVSGF